MESDPTFDRLVNFQIYFSRNFLTEDDGYSFSV